jgi:hypothetical protein
MLRKKRLGVSADSSPKQFCLMR